MYKLIFLLYTIIMIGCTTSDNIDENILKGNYSFTVFDSLNQQAADGEFTINKIEKDKVKGVYKLINVISTENFPANMLLKKGNYAGVLKNDKIYINMNPKVADNNLFITLVIKNDSLNGTWSQSTILGVIKRGYIRSIKSNN